MAKLTSLIANTETLNGGEWIDVGIGADQFRIKTRGFTDAFRDGLFSVRRLAARDLNRGLQPGAQPYTATDLPPNVDDKCLGSALADFCVLDVDGLYEDDAGTIAVTADAFRAMLREPSGKTAVLVLVNQAAARVGDDRTAATKDIVGN